MGSLPVHGRQPDARVGLPKSKSALIETRPAQRVVNLSMARTVYSVALDTPVKRNERRCNQRSGKNCKMSQGRYRHIRRCSDFGPGRPGDQVEQHTTHRDSGARRCFTAERERAKKYTFVATP